MMNSSGFIVYADESGDQIKRKKGSPYPMFVLAFCIFKIEEYFKFANQFLKLKFKYLNHDATIFHENDIRHHINDFTFLKENPELEEELNSEIASMINKHVFKVIANAINKDELKSSNNVHSALYNTSLEFCLGSLQEYLTSLGLNNISTHVILETRSKEENKDVKKFLEKYHRKCISKSIPYNIETKVSHKRTNTFGLQLADLIARPIGLSVLKPEQPNRAHDIIKKKYLCDKNGNYLNVGLKINPKKDRSKSNE